MTGGDGETQRSNNAPNGKSYTAGAAKQEHGANGRRQHHVTNAGIAIKRRPKMHGKDTGNTQRQRHWRIDKATFKFAGPLRPKGVFDLVFLLPSPFYLLFFLLAFLPSSFYNNGGPPPKK